MKNFIQGFIGNQISKDYDFKEVIASGGSGNIWKISNGKKKTTQQQVSIFVVDKKIVEDNFGRKDGEKHLLESLKKEVHNLLKLRHPNILQIVQSVTIDSSITSSSSISFATEPLVISIANILESNYMNGAIKNSFELDDLEIQKGLNQISHGLTFCHDNALIIHGNLTPENIYLTTKFDWKIAGFSFSISMATMAKEGEKVIIYCTKFWPLMVLIIIMEATVMFVDHLLII
jgi:SCY1-like protein 2